MTDSHLQAAVAKPFRNFMKLVGVFCDAVYHFFDSLVNPNRGRYSGGRYVNPRSSGFSSGARIATLRPPGSGSSAPNMSIGGCRSCQ